MTPLHPVAERAARLAKYTGVRTTSGRGSEYKLAEYAALHRSGILTLNEIRGLLYGQ